MRRAYHYCLSELQRLVYSVPFIICITLALFAAIQTTNNMTRFKEETEVVFNAWDVFFGVYGNVFFMPGFLFPIALTFLLGDMFIEQVNSKYFWLVQQRITAKSYFAMKMVAMFLTLGIFVTLTWIISILVGMIAGFQIFPINLSAFGTLPNAWAFATADAPIYNAFESSIQILPMQFCLIIYFTCAYFALISLVILLCMRARSRFLPVGIMFIILAAQYVTAWGMIDILYNWSTLGMLSDSLHRPFAMAGMDQVSGAPVPWSTSILLMSAIICVSVLVCYFINPLSERARNAQRRKELEYQQTSMPS